jgi:hypothetical protein
MTEVEQSAPRRLVITPRDIALMESLSAARYLTVECLEWLHWHGWEERKAKAAEATAKYTPARHLYERLSRMHDAGLLLKIVRPVMVAQSTYGRAPDLYALSRLGAEMVADVTGRDIAEISYEKAQPLAWSTREHAAFIGQCYAALRTRLEKKPDERQLTSWQVDRELAKSFDRIPIQMQRYDQATKEQKIQRKDAPILPDAAFMIERSTGDRLLFFVEIDRGRGIDSWREKIRAYAAYQGSAQLKARYEVERFILLTATTTDHKRTRMMEETAQAVEDREQRQRYFFTLLEAMTPATIGQWWYVAQATTSSRVMLDRVIVTPKITAASYELFT